MPGVEDSIRQAMSEAQSGRQQEAMAILRSVLDEAPDQPDANWIMGTLMANSGQVQGGIHHLERAVRHRPENAQMAYQLGALYGIAGQFPQSAHMMQRAVELSPDWHVALNGLATAMYMAGDFDGADRTYRRSIAANSGQVEAATGLAGMLMLGGRPQEAATLYRKAAEAFPQRTDVVLKLVSALNYAVDAEPLEIRAAAERWVSLVMPGVPEEERAHTFENTREPDRPLRVGIIAHELFDQPPAAFVRSILEGRDRSRMRAVVYNLSQRADAVTQTLRSAADEWHDYAGRSESQIATLIRTDGVDILIELAGHGSGNELLIMRRRCAPVQVSYLGYPATTGLPTIDYRIVDSVTDPLEAKEWHSEKLVRLNGCFACYTPPPGAPEVVPPPCMGETAQRAGEGWDSGWFTDPKPVTFGSFNNIRKLSPVTVQLWAGVLKAVPDSQLLLKFRGASSAYMQRHIAEQFAATGVDTQRISAHEAVDDKREHLARYGQVDIALDTSPYNGVGTTCEALYMGVPVVTLEGRMHAGRVGASLLTAAGLRQHIARSPEEYVRIAADLASDRTRLADLRKALRAQILGSELCNRAAHARRFEGALREMWRAWCREGGA